MRNCVCPSCGASLTLDDNNRDFGFCQYCGSKVMFDDYRSTHRIIDEARIKEAESEQIIRLRELELEEKEKRRKRIGKTVAYSLAFIIAVISAITWSLDDGIISGFGLLGAVFIAGLATDK